MDKFFAVTHRCLHMGAVHMRNRRWEKGSGNLEQYGIARTGKENSPLQFLMENKRRLTSEG